MLFDIIAQKKPKIVILENVKHIKHVSKGVVFKYIISSLEALEYKVSCQLVNAKDYGVPQNRERWIFIGVLAGKKYEFKMVKNKQTLLRDVIQKDGEFTYLEESYTLIDKPKIQPSGLKFVGYRNKKIRTTGVKEGTYHLSRVHKQPNRIYSIDGIHPTLPSQESSGRFWILLECGRVRKMTVLECFRVMGFKDTFKKPVSEGSLYRQIGNSVCVPMVKSIVKDILIQMRIN